MKIRSSVPLVLTGLLTAGAAHAFQDVPPSSPNYGYIQAIALHGVTSGCSVSPSLYCPDDAVTRAQMAVFMIRALGLQPDASGAPAFSDVPTSHFAYGYIQRFRQLGITGGCGGGKFCPQDPVTRAQMAIFMVRALGKAPSGGAPVFSDVPANAFGFDHIQTFAKLGITAGCGGGKFCPDSSVTRSQMAVFLTRAFDLFFTGTPLVDPELVYVGDPARDLRFQIRLAPVAYQTLAVEETDAGGAVLGTACAPKDDGDPGDGDDIQGDSVFSCVLPGVSGSATAVRYFRLRLADSYYQTASAPIYYPIMKHITDADLQDLSAEGALANATWQSTLNIVTTVDALKARPEVQTAGYGLNGNGVWWLTKAGILGALNVSGANKGGAGDRDSSPALRALTRVDRQSSFRADQRFRAASRSAGGSLFRTTDRNLDWVEGVTPPEAIAPPPAAATQPIGNAKAFLAAPFFNDFCAGACDETDEIKAMLDAMTCPEFDTSAFYLNGEATVDRFKEIANKGVIAISSHGDNLLYLTDSLALGEWGVFWHGVWGLPFGSGEVITCTGEEVTPQGRTAHEDDIRLGRVVYYQNQADGNFGITPKFIRDYAAAAGGLPDSIVYLSTCRSAFNDTMAQAYLDSGAAVVFGYTDYVAPSFSDARGKDLFQKLTQGKTTGAAFTPGLCNNGACFAMTGSASAEIGLGDSIANGGFEDGELSAWTKDGDGRVEPVLGNSYLPPAGTFMGIISTGLGRTTTAGSISQTLCLPPDVKKLNFRWNFLSEEFLEFCSSQYQDAFNVVVTPSGGSPTNLYGTHIDLLCSTVVPSSVSFDQGDVYETGWKAASIDISAFAGTTVTITFAADDVGDSVYDTVVLLDEIGVAK